MTLATELMDMMQKSVTRTARRGKKVTLLKNVKIMVASLNVASGSGPHIKNTLMMPCYLLYLKLVVSGVTRSTAMSVGTAALCQSAPQLKDLGRELIIYIQTKLLNKHYTKGF